MKEGIVYTGYPSKEELKNCLGIPSEERMKKGRVAVIECVQEIPCNPCEAACKFGAIHIGETITTLPCIKEENCTGCGACIAACPGLAIIILDKYYNKSESVIEFPFEYLPLPEEGDFVDAVNRRGEVVCRGKILSIKKLPSYEGTCIIRMLIPVEFADEVRSIKRLKNK